MHGSNIISRLRQRERIQLMTMVAGSDILQFVYDGIQNGSLEPEDHEPKPPR